MGRFKDGRFDLVVVADFALDATTETQWRRSFEKASEIFFDATEGQVQYGRIFVCDESIGLDSAEVILHDSGDPSYGTWGQFGVPGEALHLMPYVRFQVLTHHHEMGHHVWALGEEYAAEAVLEEIDTSVAPADNKTIPLVGSAYAAGDLVGDKAILKFGDALQRRTITANTATSVTVGVAFTQSPTTDSDGWVQYQFDAACSTVADSNYCIMEHSRDAAGTLDAAGVWTPAAHPVTEFCTDSNHDPDGDTQQETRNHDSCWEAIVSRPAYSTLVAPDPAAPGPTVGAVPPEWIFLDKQPRFVVAIDRSGSMSVGHKMTDAQHGAVYWLEFCATADDQLAVVAYDNVIDTVLPLTQVSAIAGGIAAVADDIDLLTPRGATNIRDALLRSLDEIESLPTRSATQVTLLLTDGVHNYPMGSAASEALPALQEGGVRVYTLGVGAPGTVDEPGLEAIATGTGGRAYVVGDDEPAVIENAMIEINAEVRGGIITTAPVLFPDSRADALDRLLRPYLDRADDPARRGRPSLGDVLRALKVRSAEELLTARRRRSRRAVAVAVEVEEGADRAAVTVAFPVGSEVWLYLIDPTGAVVDTSAGAATLVDSAAPHEFIVVRGPMAGRWIAVAVRVAAGARFTARLVAGGENRRLQVFAGGPGVSPPKAPVRLWAKARWRHELTGLAAYAEVTAPSGARARVHLSDGGIAGRGTGLYEGLFVPTERGRHRAVLTVAGRGRCSVAGADRLLLHATGDSFDAATKTPRFVRRVVVHFDVTGRRAPEQASERPFGPTGRKRATKIRSARNVPRHAPAGPAAAAGVEGPALTAVEGDRPAAGRRRR